MKKINILIAIPSLDSGGVEMGVLEFCKQVSKTQDFNLFIATSGGKLINQIDKNIKIIPIDIKSKNPFIIWKNQGKIKQILLENKIDVVQIESRIPAWNFINICKKLHIPTVSIIHGNFGIGNGIVKKFKLFYNSKIMQADSVVAVSNYTKQYCLNNYANCFKNKDINVIYRGIDAENVFNPEKVSNQEIEELKTKLHLPNDKKIIIYPARLSKQKGQEYLVETLNILRNKNVICLLVGSNDKHLDYKNHLINLINEYKLENNIKFVDNITNINVLYKICDIAVSSAILPETFGRVSIECEAMQKIFIGTAIGGTLETAIDKQTGFLVPHNNAEIFAKTIENILNLTDEEMLKIGTEARKNVLNNFTIDVFYNKMKNLYFNIINGGKNVR